MDTYKELVSIGLRVVFHVVSALNSIVSGVEKIFFSFVLLVGGVGLYSFIAASQIFFLL